MLLVNGELVLTPQRVTRDRVWVSRKDVRYQHGKSSPPVFLGPYRPDHEEATAVREGCVLRCVRRRDAAQPLNPRHLIHLHGPLCKRAQSVPEQHIPLPQLPLPLNPRPCNARAMVMLHSFSTHAFLCTHPHAHLRDHA